MGSSSAWFGSSMMILEIDVLDRLAAQLEGQAIVACHRHAPTAPTVTLERMQSPPGIAQHLAELLRFLNRGQHGAELFHLLGGQAAHVVIPPEAFKPFVPKAPDAHIEAYGIAVRLSKYLDKSRAANPYRGSMPS